MIEIKQKASSLRKEKRYKETIELLKPFYNSNWEDMDEWSVWDYAYSLRQEKEFREAIDVCEKSLSRWPNFEQLKTVYAWSLYYDCLINNDKLTVEEKMRKAEVILEHSTLDKYSPKVKSVLFITKLLKENQRYTEMLNYLTKLHVESLDTNNFKYKSPDGRTVILASELEQYYNFLTEALLKTSKFKECIEESQKALTTIKNFQNSNDFWLNRRMAKSYQEMGNVEEARKIYEELISKKHDWFLYAELAQLLYDTNSLDESLRYAIISAKEYGEIEKKVNLIELLAHILEKLGRKEESEWHYCLTHKIRLEHGWKVSEFLQDKIKRIRNDKVEIQDYNEFLRKVKKIWNDIQGEVEPNLEGKVTSLLANGKSGFIATPGGSSYFFNCKSFVDRKANAKIGLSVSFRLRDSYDAKKQRASKEAVNIEIKKP